jgi:hypothetical protein
LLLLMLAGRGGDERCEARRGCDVEMHSGSSDAVAVCWQAAQGRCFGPRVLTRLSARLACGVDRRSASRGRGESPQLFIDTA